MSELIERLEAWSDLDTEYGHNARGETIAIAAATIAQLQAELAEAREVPGRIVDWLREDAEKDAGDQRRLHAGKKLTPLMTEGWDTLIQTKIGIATAIEARDWSKP